MFTSIHLTPPWVSVCRFVRAATHHVTRTCTAANKYPTINASDSYSLPLIEFVYLFARFVSLISYMFPLGLFPFWFWVQLQFMYKVAEIVFVFVGTLNSVIHYKIHCWLIQRNNRQRCVQVWQPHKNKKKKEKMQSFNKCVRNDWTELVWWRYPPFGVYNTTI